jgi:type IV pilus assembly protein PilW
LVETMVALVIGLVLMAGIIELFIGSKQTYTLQEAMARVQENGRFAVDQLNWDLRMAGHMGCANARVMEAEVTPPPTTFIKSGRIRVALVTNPGDNTWGLANAVEGSFWDGAGWTPALPAAAAAALPGSDTLTLRKVSGRRLPLTGLNPGAPEGSGSAPLRVPLNSGLRQFDIVMVGDCVNAAIFQITSDDATIAAGQLAHDVGAGVPGNVTVNLGKDFAPNANAGIMAMTSYTYFIAPGASGAPALFQSADGAVAQELVENVERMRVTYGVGVPDGNGNLVPTGYQTADTIAAAGLWRDVISVRINLLLRSDNNVTDTAQPYTYTHDTGVEVLPADRRLRQVFTTTIGLRSWLP